MRIEKQLSPQKGLTINGGRAPETIGDRFGPRHRSRLPNGQYREISYGWISYCCDWKIFGLIETTQDPQPTIIGISWSEGQRFASAMEFCAEKERSGNSHAEIAISCGGRSNNNSHGEGCRNER